MFQSVPGSYQFSVAVQKPRQTELFSTEVPEPKALTDTFLAILRAAGEDPAARLSDVVPKDDYRTTFLKMTRNLAPTGKSFGSLEIRAADDREAVILTPNSRKNIAETLRTAEIGGSPDTRDNETMLRGILRALDLDHDWLEISVQGTHKRIRGVGETVDDLIGPMVNREVVVRVRPGRGRSLTFIDIEQDE